VSSGCYKTNVEPIIGEVGADEAKELANKRKYRNGREYGKLALEKDFKPFRSVDITRFDPRASKLRMGLKIFLKKKNLKTFLKR
jgi:hypothetical protein